MSKYYKAEDVIAFLNLHCPKDMWEYQIADLPTIEVSEEVLPIDHCIMCYEFLRERIGSEITDNSEEFEKWFERMVWHVQKCNEDDTEMRNVSEDCISRDWVYNALTKVTAVTPTQIDMLSDFTDIIKNAPSVVPTNENKCHRHGIRLEDGTPIYECIGCDEQDCERK